MSGHPDTASRSVLIVDDDEDVTALLDALVGTRPGYRVIGSHADPDAGEAAAVELQPEVVVVGAHRETFPPIDLIDRIHRAVPDACVVLLADLPDPITLLDALACGASTVLSSSAGWSELMPALDLLVDTPPPAHSRHAQVA
jgi:DNA-binding NarL/FixJ family response regulator